LSLGEYSALYFAGAVSFADALRLIARQKALMQQAAQRRAGGMVSLVGGEEAGALALCERVAPQGHIQPANYNCPGQVVVSGDRAACEAAAQLAGEFGLRAVPLPVAGAFHSDHMVPAAEELRPILEACPFQTPRCRVVANVTCDYHAGPAGIRDLLYQQVFSPVRWQGCVERLIADGCDEFYEIGPNRHLTGMMRKIARKMPATSIGTLADLAPAGAARGTV
jgi:[acyl-carrier-protein] S-malonyltransferase